MTRYLYIIFFLKLKLQNICCCIYNTTVIPHIKLKSKSRHDSEFLLLFILISSDELLIVLNMTFKSFYVPQGGVPDSVTPELSE